MKPMISARDGNKAKRPALKKGGAKKKLATKSADGVEPRPSPS